MYEKKHLTTNISAASASASGVITCLNDMVQGTSALTRIGQQIHCVELTACGNWALQATESSDVCRIIVFKDITTDGAAPGVTDVLETANYSACYNRDKVGSRFHIYYDELFPMMNSAPTVTVNVKTFFWKKKLDFTTFYAGNAGTVSDIVKGGLFVLYITLGGTSNLFANFQLCFVDN